MKLIKQSLGNLEKALDIIYSGAINGVPKVFDSAYELADDYKTSYPNDLNKQISSLIKNQCLQSGSAGFVTNLGGIITLPVTLPANITSVLYIQLRMIAAIAILCGYSPKNDRVKTILLCCLIGDSIAKVLKKAGLKITTKVGYKMISKIPGEVIKKINKIIGFRLLTKYGANGIVNISKLVPIAGAVVAGGLDALSTNKIGNYTKNTFMFQDVDSFVYAK